MNERESTCPLCGREAYFRYANDEERRRGSPLCWGESEDDCPGYAQWVDEKGGGT